jgi:hypothetical protein
MDETQEKRHRGRPTKDPSGKRVIITPGIKQSTKEEIDRRIDASKTPEGKKKSIGDIIDEAIEATKGEC